MTRAALLVLLLALGACGGDEAPAPSPEPQAPDPAPEPAPPAAVPAPAVPEGDLRGDAAAGARVYQQFCSLCHGVGGKGDGPGAQTDPPPADHSDRAYMASLSDAHLYQVIAQGGASVGKSPLMTPWGGVLSDEQIRDLIAHLRALSGT